MVIDWSAVKAVKIPEGDVKRVAIDGTVVWEKGGLPSEYQQVEYIESTGTQYINTGVIGNTGIHIVAEMGYATAGYALFGSRNPRFFVTLYPSTNFDFGYNGDIITEIYVENRKIYSIDFDTSVYPARFGIDGVYRTSTAQSDTNRPIYIFCCNFTGSPKSWSKSIFKSMTITDKTVNCLETSSRATVNKMAR